MSLREELLARFPALSGLPPGCHAVGGAVRDLVHGRDPADIDVACPDARAAAGTLSTRLVRLGDQRHLSAWRVTAGGHVYDFADLLDGDIRVDLGRRDFTINAMAVDLSTGELLDPHGGRSDLARGLVRMVDASNFDDDPLRVVKGVRMAVVLGFQIEAGTLEAMRLRASRVAGIAAERVVYELSVVFSAGRFRRAVELLSAAGLNEPLGLATGSFAADDVSEAGAYALLVRDARAHARRWRWSDALRQEVTALQRLAERHDRMALYDAGERAARQLPAVLRALGRDDRLDWPDFRARALLDGNEIAALLGIGPGARLGTVKRALLEAQVRGEVATRDEAEAFVRRAASTVTGPA